MATNINSFGINTSDATATADKILSGYTAYANGEALTGTYNPSFVWKETIMCNYGTYFPSGYKYPSGNVSFSVGPKVNKYYYYIQSTTSEYIVGNGSSSYMYATGSGSMTQTYYYLAAAKDCKYIMLVTYQGLRELPTLGSLTAGQVLTVNAADAMRYCIVMFYD